MNIAYVRVSTVEQNEERQIEGLQKYNIDKWFTEKNLQKIPIESSFRLCLILSVKGILFTSMIFPDLLEALGIY